MENWSVTSEERKVFETQFLSLKPSVTDGTISGEDAKGFFVQSGLPANILAFIWELSDVTRDGQLNLGEFIVACKLIQMKLRGNNIPPALPAPLIQLLQSSSTSVTRGVTSGASPVLGNASIKENAPLVAAPTPPPAPIPASPATNYEWSVPYNTKLKYTQVFNQADKGRTGFLTGVQARGIMVLTQLPIETLAKIWTLADIDGDGQLTCEEFVLAMHLCDMVKSGKELKSPLPADLLPPTFVKKSRQNSVTSIGSASDIAAAITGSAAVAPANSSASASTVTSPQAAAFEDKRKENYERGQAELERRRKALFEIQKQEREERERLEREEEERKERIRLEQEKRRQEEMEKQLQKQRELEREKEMLRQKEMEQREIARRELERQRHQEWEKQRIQDLRAHLKKELDYVTLMREKNEKLNAEYQTLCDKVRELSQKTGETRNGVNAVKSTIDGMRVSRDSLLNDITSLKHQLKEQNHRLINLNKEKTNLERKRSNVGFSEKEITGEEVPLDLASEQYVLNQLRNDVQEMKAELDRKKVALHDSLSELNGSKDKMNELLKTCDTLYSVYSEKRKMVLDLKAQKLNDVSQWSNSAWDTAPDDWSSSQSVHQSAELNDSSSENVEGGSKKCRALYEFVARNDDELSFQPGDVITVSSSQNSEPGWLAGELKGKTGWFPESYVEYISDGVYASATGEDTAATATLCANGIDPTLEDIAEVPENISENDSSWPADAPSRGAPAAVGDTPSLEAGCIASLAVQALYPWSAQNENQLSLNESDIVRVTRKCDNWYYGENQGYAGWFPASYCKEITTNDSIDLATDFDDNYVAIYAYSSAEPDDLCFEQNDMIKVTKKDGDWWTGTLNGKTGVFPATYVQKVDYQSSSFSPSVECSAQVPRCASAPPTQFENQQNIPTNRAMTPDFSSLSSSEVGRNKKPEIATVIAPYQATSKEQLSLQRGQLIMIRKKTTTGWWEGESHVKGKKRQIGWFPASYVKVVGGGGITSPVNVVEQSRKPSFQSSLPTPPSSVAVATSTTPAAAERVIALYKYSAQNADELSFEKDDIIKMISKEEPEWWKGELNGAVGLFPSNYVQPL